MEKNNKLKVDIYVPLEACVCEWDKFMNRVFAVLTPYIKYIECDTRNLNSEDTRELDLHGKCVVVDGNKKFSAAYLLKKQLPILLKERALI